MTNQSTPIRAYYGLLAYAPATMPERREQLYRPSRGRSVAAAISGAWPRPEQRIPVRGSWIRATLASAREIMAEWRRRARSRNELMTLSDRDLRDVRWTRAEAEAECRKPFWRV